MFYDKDNHLKDTISSNFTRFASPFEKLEIIIITPISNTKMKWKKLHSENDSVIDHTSSVKQTYLRARWTKYTNFLGNN